jgi:hypothetical protein
MDQTKQALSHWNVTSSYRYDCLSYTAVQSQINNDHPILAGLFPGHMNLIRGYDTSYNGVLFIDPEDGDYHAQNYDDYCSGTHWDGEYYRWMESLFDCT